MSRNVSTLPRYVKPENLEIGDVVRVAWPERNGIRKIHEGRIARRDYAGRTRMFVTAEGATLFAWEPSLPAPRITLLERRAEPASTLF